MPSQQAEEEEDCCKWQGKYVDLEAHLKGCLYRVKPCALCGQKIAARDEVIHVNEKCRMRPIPCQYCKIDIPFVEVDSHAQTCPVSPLAFVECSCAQKIQRKNLNTHVMENLSSHLISLKEENDRLKSENSLLHRSLTEVKSQLGLDSTNEISVNVSIEAPIIEGSSFLSHPFWFKGIQWEVMLERKAGLIGVFLGSIAVNGPIMTARVKFTVNGNVVFGQVLISMTSFASFIDFDFYFIFS